MHGNCYSAVLCVRAVRSSAVPWSEHCEVGHRIHTRYKATHPAWSRRSGVRGGLHAPAESHGESGRGNGINAVRLRLPGSLATPTGDDEDDLKHVSMIRVPCRDALAVKKLLLAELPPYKLHVEL